MTAMNSNEQNDKDLTFNDNYAGENNIPDETPEYDPYTGMFSDNPYDLSTGEFIPKKTELPKPNVELDLKLEFKKKLLAFGIMATIMTPIVIITYFSSINTFSNTNMILHNDLILMGLSFLGVLATIFGAFLIIRYNSSTGATRRIDARVFYMGLPSSLLCASLVTPEYSYIGNAICIGLIIASIVSFVIIFSKKLSLGSRTFCTIALLIMASICFFSGSYEKLTLMPFELDSEYIILTKRPESQLPPETDRRVFISTNINVEKQDYCEYRFTDYETFCCLVSENENLRMEYPLLADPTKRAAIELNDMIKDKLSERAGRYDRNFFTKHDLFINVQYYPQNVNDIHIANSNILRDHIQYDLKVDYTEPVKNHYIKTDVAIEFLIMPKDSSNNVSYKIIENVTGFIYREEA